MRKLFYLLLSITVLNVGCLKEGPPGPQGTAGISGTNGKNGTNGTNGIGKDGTDGTATCSKCHSNDMKLVAYQKQYNVSKHASGFQDPSENRKNCSGCHTNEGFNQRVDDGSFSGLPANGFLNATPISCYTCHFIHKTFTLGDYSLKTTSAVSLLVNTSTTVDMGTSNLCLQCHQSIAYSIANLPVSVSTDTLIIVDESFGPHSGAQGNMIAGVGKSGAFEIQGKLPYVNSSHISNITRACITCHMGPNCSGVKGGGHSLSTKLANDSWNTDACVSCHSDITVLNALIDKSRNEIDSLRSVLESTLAAKGWIQVNNMGDYVVKASSTAPLKVTAIQARVIYNYRFLSADHSGAGVHNYKYAKALLSNSIDVAKTW